MNESHLGPYELIEKLGDGGMATVFRARQPSMDREVAVKVIRSSLTHESGARERFQREARLIARLEHPHIVPVYDFDGSHEPPYIVMRYVKGSTLKDILQGRAPAARLAIQDVLAFLRQAASALDYAHRQGVIHRDIKPSNMILDQDGNLFLMDFGIARFTEQASLKSSGVIGTPAYMAPEQAMGVGEVGPPADIYSFGVVTFELLAGKLPFEAETQMALAFKHLQDAPPKASQLNSDLPTAVDAVLERVLDKQPIQRFESASDFLLALETALGLSNLPAAAPLLIDVSPQSRTAAGDFTTTSEQNKVVSVLYADAAEFAEIVNAAAGVENARAMLRELWAEAQQSILARQGRVVATGETDLMAIWGAETVREDDAEQAVHAALELQDLLRQVGQSYFVESEVEPLPLRAAVNTGMALVSPPSRGQAGDGELPVKASGTALTLAQRLAENADGVVLITHPTYREVAGVFSIRPAGPLWVRGLKEAMDTYLVMAVKARRFRVRQRGIEGLETRMIGREVQLKQMQNAWLDAIEERETQMITITGEAGIGKSRLLYEFTRWAELRPERVRFFQGRATPEMSSRPYALWRDILMFRFQILENDPAQVVHQKMEHGVAELLGRPELEMAHLMGYLAGFDFTDSPFIKGILADPQQLSQRARQLALRFFTRLGADWPIVMVLEELHYADDASLDLIIDLATSQPDLPLALFGLGRPEFFERRPTWGAGQHTHKRITLGPLDRRDSRDLARELLQNAPDAPRPLRDFLVDRSEGNPLYMEELVKMLLDDRVIVKESELEWRVQPERLDDARVPPSLSGLLQARLDSLLYPERLTLQRAAVVGRVFYDSALQALDAADEPRDHLTDLPAILEQLAERGFIQRRELSAFAGSVEYMFTQSMLRDQIYAALLRRQVAVYHGALARWLSASERANEYLPRIAECYEKANEIQLAVDALCRAGRQALEHSAPREALQFFERALLLLPVSLTQDEAAAAVASDRHGFDRALILLSLGETRRMLGQISAAQVDLKSALELALHANQKPQIALILYHLSEISDLQGDYPAVRAYLEQALTLARQLPEKGAGQSLLAQILHGLGSAEWRAGNFEQAMGLTSECLELSRQLNIFSLELRALNMLGLIHFSSGDLEQARALYESGRQLAEKTGNRERLMSLLNNLGELDRTESQFQSALERYQQALAINDEIGNQYMGALLHFNLGLVALVSGETQQAKASFLDSLRQAHAMGAPPLVLAALIGLAWEKARDHDYPTALAWLGMAFNHPAADVDLHTDAEPLMAELRQSFPEEEIQGGMQRGHALNYDELVQKLLKSAA